MTQEELMERFAEIDRTAALQKGAACMEFAKSNAKYKIGDIVGDSTNLIRIERIKFARSGYKVMIYYSGPKLTKKGEPRKNGESRAVFETSIKRVGL